jgi:hypothetical protein
MVRRVGVCDAEIDSKFARRSTYHDLMNDSLPDGDTDKGALAVAKATMQSIQ